MSIDWSEVRTGAVLLLAVVASVIDLRTRRVPNALTVTAVAIAVAVGGDVRVLRHVLLPQGLAVNLSFKQQRWLDEPYLERALIGEYGEDAPRIRPGQEMRKGTRTPPSQTWLFEPRRGALLPPFSADPRMSAAPLSLMKITRVPPARRLAAQRSRSVPTAKTPARCARSEGHDNPAATQRAPWKATSRTRRSSTCSSARCAASWPRPGRRT